MIAACPGCTTGVGLSQDGPAGAGAGAAGELLLSLPDIHCAACIASVEDTLAVVPGVREAQVNLTQRRVRIAAPGVAPDALVAALAAAGHRARPLDQGLLAGRSPETRDLLMRIGVAGFAAMNVMLLSVAVWSGATDATARLFHLVSAAIALPAVAFAGRPFFAAALGALRHRRLNMDVPIALAIVLASGVSLAGALGLLGAGERPGWFDAALALTFFLLVGRYLDHAGRQAARSAASELAALEVPQAVLVAAGGDRVVPAARLAAGDVIRLRPGDRVPADGVVVEGRGDADRSALTGESAAQPVGPGARLSAGEIALTGMLLLRVEAAGRDTALARLAELVATAENQRSRYAGLAEKAARIYAPLVHLLGAAALVGWWLATRDGLRALDVAISVLVITCPCALGLAVPAVSTVVTGRLFRRGLLVKSRTALERLAEIDTVAFDKTGTLTSGRLQLVGAPAGADLALAAGLARGSNHPASRALVAAAEARGLAPVAVADLREHPGQGVEGCLAGMPCRLGRPDWLGLPAGTEGVALARGGAAPMLFVFAEEPRPDAAGAIDALRAAGFRLALLSGDAPVAAARVGAVLGIAEARGGMTPEDKARWLRDRAAEGHRVLMVGDGLNDAAALALAHASAAPGSALDAARSLADVVLLGDGPSGIPRLLRMARLARARMRQNVALAAAYNLVAVPLALAGLATPLLAALAMSASSLTVTLNALRGRG